MPVSLRAIFAGCLVGFREGGPQPCAVLFASVCRGRLRCRCRPEAAAADGPGTVVTGVGTAVVRIAACLFRECVCWRARLALAFACRMQRFPVQSLLQVARGICCAVLLRVLARGSLRPATAWLLRRLRHLRLRAAAVFRDKCGSRQWGHVAHMLLGLARCSCFVQRRAVPAAVSS